MKEEQKRIEVLVALWIDEHADIQEVIQEMDYSFSHAAIGDTEIIDVYTEI